MAYKETLEQLKHILLDELLVVNCIAPTPYLLPFVNENEIIYIFKNKNLILDTTRTENSFCLNSSEDLDITGQPLECPFSINDESDFSINVLVKKEEKNTHYPLTLQDARNICTDFNLKMNVTIPCFILTDGTDKEHTILLGMIKNEGWRTRCWVTSDGISSNNNVVNVDKMIRYHYALSMINPIHTVSEVSCKYTIEYMDDKNDTFLQESPGNLEFNLNWKTPSFDVPLHEVFVKITINSRIGNETSEISSMWDQLILLYEYLEIIKKWKSEKMSQGLYSRFGISWPNIKRQNDEMLVQEAAADQLTRLLREPNQNNSGLTNKSVEESKQNLEIIVQQILKGRERTFTDKLWNLLIECASYKEMFSFLEKVFQYVKNGLCKPYIKSTNSSRLSDILRCCKSDKANFEMILEPLELLIEIGIEKLKTEYISIFLLAKIATVSKLDIPKLPKFADISASDWIDTCSEWITWLIRVHISLQLLLTTESIMKCKTCIVPLMTSTLEHYLGPQSPIEKLISPKTILRQIFTTSVNIRDINDLLNRKTQFNSWTLKLHSEVPKRKVTNIFHRNVDEIFPSSVSVIDDLETSGTNASYLSNTLPYHSYQFHSVSDKFF